jgi:tRNA threonylcarbamoyladenosine biosynthesis protein TsaE
MKTVITQSSKETRELGKKLAGKIKRDSIFALKGDLGIGKTTFTQGLLKGLGAKGPYTSPTFVVIKHYKSKFKVQSSKFKFFDVYHVDAYRVTAKDILNLGWREMIDQKNNIIIIEWADRIKKIIPRGAIWIKFKWLDENKRKITFK